MRAAREAIPVGPRLPETQTLVVGRRQTGELEDERPHQLGGRQVGRRRNVRRRRAAQASAARRAPGLWPLLLAQAPADDVLGDCPTERVQRSQVLTRVLPSEQDI